MDDYIFGELRYYQITLSPKLKNLIVVPFSDAHYGNPLFSLKSFLNTRDYIRDNPEVYTILNGDLAESAIRTSKGEIYRQVGTPQDQRDWIIERLLPIKDKILGMASGNHEDRITNEVGVDISKDIATALGVPYRSDGIMLKICFGNYNSRVKGKPWVYWGYATHGYGGARTASAKAVKVERTSAYVHSDFYVMSHDHVVNAAPVVYLIADPRTTLNSETGFITGKVKAHRKMLIKSNAHLKWGGYAERGGFSPNDLETPLIKLSGISHRVRVEI